MDFVLRFSLDKALSVCTVSLSLNTDGGSVISLDFHVSLKQLVQPVSSLRQINYDIPVSVSRGVLDTDQKIHDFVDCVCGEKSKWPARKLDRYLPQTDFMKH